MIFEICDRQTDRQTRSSQYFAPFQGGEVLSKMFDVVVGMYLEFSSTVVTRTR